MAVNLAGTVTASAAQDAAALQQIFATITAESCPAHFNFHMHTLCSDGQLEPERLIEQAVRIGLQGLAITDHHSVNGYRRAQQWLDAQKTAQKNLQKTAQNTFPGDSPLPTLEACSLPHLWTGTEISANLLGEEVHILAYAFDVDHGDLLPYLQGETTTGELYQSNCVIAAIHQAGGLAILAHPVRYRKSPEVLIPAAVEVGIDGVETYYAYGNPSPWKPSPKQTPIVETLSRQYGLLNTCGTDTHGLSLLQRI